MARDYFDQAIARDPDYAQAYSGLADTYALLGDWQYAVMAAREAFPACQSRGDQGSRAGRQARRSSHVACVLPGWLRLGFRVRRKEFRRGVELNPGYATAHHWYAWHLALLGRDREAIAEMRKAANLDPLSLIINADLSELLLIAHFPDESVQQSRKTIEMDPRFALAHNQLGEASLQKGCTMKRSPNCRKPSDRAGAARRVRRIWLARTPVSGRKNDAVQLLIGLKQRSSPGYSNASEIATIYAALGDKDQSDDLAGSRV